MSEQWLPAPGLEGRYEVSDQGRVRSLPRPRTKGRILAAAGDPRGYQRFTAAVDGVRLNFSVHRLICEAFHGPPSGDAALVRHLNDRPSDNRAVNLAWGTVADNERDKILNGNNAMLNRTHCPQGHAYEGENILRHTNGERRCRECNRARMKRKRAEASWGRPCPVCGEVMRGHLKRHMDRKHSAVLAGPAGQECVKVAPDPGHEDEGYSCVTHNCAWDECPAQTDQEDQS